MNNTIDCKRFGKLLSRDFRNIWPSFGLTMLIIVLLPLVAWLFCLAFLSELTILPEARIGFIGGCVLLCAIMAPSRLYKTCNLPKRGIYFAMLPASKLEKFLSMLFYSVLVCPLMVLAGGIAFDCLLTLLPFGPYTLWLTQTGTPLLDGMSVGDLFVQGLADAYMSPNFFLATMIFSYFWNAVVFFFTNTIFKKHKVLLTILWTMLISFILQLVITPFFMHSLTGPEFVVNPSRFACYYWIGLAFTIVCTGVLLWWSSYRLKKMKY